MRNPTPLVFGLIVVLASLGSPRDAHAAGFDTVAASAALAKAATTASACKTAGGPTGTAQVKVTFAPNGTVTAAQVEGPPFAGTPIGSCVTAAFLKAQIPPFTGAPVEARRSVTIS